MSYTIELKPQAMKDCKKLPQREIQRIFEKIEHLQENLQGDVKKVTNVTPEYRLRVG